MVVVPPPDVVVLPLDDGVGFVVESLAGSEVVVEGGELAAVVLSRFARAMDDARAVSSSRTGSAAARSDCQMPCLKRSGKYLWSRSWRDPGVAPSTNPANGAESAGPDRASWPAISPLRLGCRPNAAGEDTAGATPKATRSDRHRTCSKRQQEGMFFLGDWCSRVLDGGLPSRRLRSSFSETSSEYPVSS